MTGAITLVWLALSGLTGASWLLGHQLGDHRAGTIAVIVIAAFKVRLVLLWFMELRHAPLAWRVASEAWAILVSAIMIGLYLVPFR